MVAVVLQNGQRRAEGAEHLALYALGAHFGAVIARQFHKAAEVVVEHAHFHALARLLFEDLQNLAPHLAFLEDEELHEDVAPGLGQLAQKRLKERLAAGEVLHARRRVDGKAHAVFQIARQARGARPLRLGLFERPLVARQAAGERLLRAFHLLAEAVHARLELHHQVKRAAEDGQGEDGEHPGELVAGLFMLADHVDGHQHAQQREHQRYQPGRFAAAEHQIPEKSDLQKQEQDDEQPVAEHAPQTVFVHKDLPQGSIAQSGRNEQGVGRKLLAKSDVLTHRKQAA